MTQKFKCSRCKSALRIEDIKVKLEKGELIRICRYCGNKVKIK